MTPQSWRVASVVALSVIASACADEDLEDPNAANPRSIAVSGIGANARPATMTDVTASPGPAANALPVFYRVQVQPGDTVAVVAERFGLRPEYVIWNNEAALRGGGFIEGASLDIPSDNGMLHRPQPGETLPQVAAHYGVEPQAILDHPANTPTATTPLPAVILVPSGRRP